MAVMVARMTNQNHIRMKTFSFRMFWGRMHSDSRVSMVPEAPNFLKLHCVTLGKVVARGSCASSSFKSKFMIWEAERKERSGGSRRVACGDAGKGPRSS